MIIFQSNRLFLESRKKMILLMKVLSYLRPKAMIAINLFSKFQQHKKMSKIQNPKKQF